MSINKLDNSSSEENLEESINMFNDSDVDDKSESIEESINNVDDKSESIEESIDESESIKESKKKSVTSKEESKKKDKSKEESKKKKDKTNESKKKVKQDKLKLIDINDITSYLTNIFKNLKLKKTSKDSSKLPKDEFKQYIELVKKFYSIILSYYSSDVDSELKISKDKSTNNKDLDKVIKELTSVNDKSSKILSKYKLEDITNISIYFDSFIVKCGLCFTDTIKRKYVESVVKSLNLTDMFKTFKLSFVKLTNPVKSKRTIDDDNQLSKANISCLAIDWLYEYHKDKKFKNLVKSILNNRNEILLGIADSNSIKNFPELWNKARDKLTKTIKAYKNKDDKLIIMNTWLNILNNQFIAENIINPNVTFNSTFNKYLAKLVTNETSITLMKEELYSIAFLFTPFNIDADNRLDITDNTIIQLIEALENKEDLQWWCNGYYSTNTIVILYYDHTCTKPKKTKKNE